MNQEAIDLLIQKQPKLAGSRDKLEAMQPGAYCMHRSWGFGVIKDYDEGEAKLVIDFEDGKDGHQMAPAFCVDKLEILEPDNILVRRRTEPDVIEEMIKKRPGDLIVEILSRLPDQEAGPTELELLLSRLLGPTKFKKWWTQTKKVLVKDPRIQTPSRKIDPYVLRDEPLKPEQEILEDFYVLKQPKKKILLAEKLYQISENVNEVEADLPNIFEHLTEAVKKASHGLSQAERLHGVWVRNDLARHLDADPETIEPTSKSLIMETEDLNELASEIPTGYQKRFLDLLSRTFPDNWQTVVIDILRNSEGKMTSESISFLVERDCEQLVADHFKRWLREQNLRGPVLLWIIKNRNSRKFRKLVDGLIGPRFLNNVLYAIDLEALQNTGTRRIPLGDILSDDKELITDMLADASEEEARDLAQGLLLNQGFEDLTKKSLLARFIKSFPSIQSLISGAQPEKVEDLIVSKKSFEALNAELRDLIEKKIPENKEAIAVAREHGDLKENSEYKMARQDQDTLMARKANLERDLGRARVTDFTEAGTDAVGVGSIVKLSNSNDQSEEYAILGAFDSMPEQNILSYKTPLGQALLGKGVGTTVTTEIDGNSVQWTIEGIERWVESGRTL
ncbi:GreA/GreB family elongation factor [Cerasicoccus frondis]|uniref:GreA/GreB family elongation factor n=1 Tax=Cerasicoccus frondis TaxID=490090 RepID=UPI002852B1EF|nr:GreA/GreB family elongation factor [Cerasicoccus frondis]